MKNTIEQDIKDSIAAKQNVFSTLVPDIEKAARTIIAALRNGNKLLTCGNGGSAADAQHFAAELVCKYDHDRRPLPAIALSTDTSALTATGNDYSFEDVFARGVEALGQKGDVLIAITTSGNSPNVLKAVATAQRKGLDVIALTGKSGGKLKGLPVLHVVVPSTVTARIQECHIMIIHSWCKLIDEALAP